MMKKEIVTSIRIDEDLWKQAKIYAVKKDMALKELVEQALKTELKKTQ